MTDDGGVVQFDFSSGGGGAAGVTMEDSTRVAALDGKEVTAVSAGSGHFAALTSGGEVYTWSAATEARSATGTLTRNSGGLAALEQERILVCISCYVPAGNLHVTSAKFWDFPL